jgi:acyl-CoA synthetase (AMP-forming)/AMP-acid ligase II
MSHIGLGGSAVPAAVTERATELGISIVRSFGSTEHPSITGNRHEAPLAKRLYTDGAPLPGVELRLIDASGADVAAGEPGEIVSRGPDCFVGYTDPDLTRNAFDADGWFATGDIGVLDADGYLAITDRKKDIIIRGGENISAAEVEELLLRVTGVAECAVVAAPDARLGEHACAFVRLRPGASPIELTDVRAHMEREGLARQKWPEELHFVDDFPRTASGKVQKFVLRQELRATFTRGR